MFTFYIGKKFGKYNFGKCGNGSTGSSKHSPKTFIFESLNGVQLRDIGGFDEQNSPNTRINTYENGDRRNSISNEAHDALVFLSAQSDQPTTQMCSE